MDLGDPVGKVVDGFKLLLAGRTDGHDHDLPLSRNTELVRWGVEVAGGTVGLDFVPHGFLLKNGSEKPSEIRSSAELGNWIEGLESGSESVREGPTGAGGEFVVLGIEVVLVNVAGEVLRCFEFAFHESTVDDDLG